MEETKKTKKVNKKTRKKAEDELYDVIDDDGLTFAQRSFVSAYIVDFHAGNAAIQAGYSEKSASAIGAQLLKKTKIQEAIKKQLESFANKNEILKLRIINQLASVAFSDFRDYGSWDGGYFSMKPSALLTRQQASLISEISQTQSDKSSNVRFKLVSKEKALELLAKHVGIATEKGEVKHSGSIGVHPEASLWDLKDPHANLLADNGDTGDDVEKLERYTAQNNPSEFDLEESEHE